MLVPTSVTRLEGQPRQMLIDKDANRAVVFSYINVASLPEGHPLRDAVGYQPNDRDWYWRSQWVSKISVFDMTNRAELRLLREVYFEGYSQTARKVDASVRVASYAWIDRKEMWDYPSDPDQLNVHVFDGSRPGKSTYLGSGRIDGMLSDQFAIDERDGAIRLATTTGMFWRWWADGDERPTPENHVWVLEPDGAQYTTVGHVGGIAKGERIMSARFVDDKAYVVTFRNIDPLFTIDVSDNAHPTLVGELEVPGFSTYLHPVGDTSLLTIGVGGDASGANWKTTISLFDVGDFANPALATSLDLAADKVTDALLPGYTEGDWWWWW